mmetsp:Transcript_2977/g.7315  ORF Transcript_2977/g.7315 Transcript_2977/m.7315 type:complete len:229 (+) Transcript_2977:257-943(+)
MLPGGLARCAPLHCTGAPQQVKRAWLHSNTPDPMPIYKALAGLGRPKHGFCHLPEAVERLGVKQHKVHLLQAAHRLRACGQRHLRRLVHGVAIDAGGDGGERHAAEAVLVGQRQGAFVGGSQQGCRLLCTLIHGAYCVDDVLGGQCKAPSDACLSCGAPHPRLHLWHLAACAQQAAARRHVDGSIHTAPTQHALVGCVHNGISLPLGDVPLREDELCFISKREYRSGW